MSLKRKNKLPEADLLADFDEISPITGNKCVLVEPVGTGGAIHKLCTESGYTCFIPPADAPTSDITVAAESLMPAYIRDYKVVDATGHPWYLGLTLERDKALAAVRGKDSKLHWAIIEPIVIPTEDPTTFDAAQFLDGREDPNIILAMLVQAPDESFTFHIFDWDDPPRKLFPIENWSEAKDEFDAYVNSNYQE